MLGYHGTLSEFGFIGKAIDFFTPEKGPAVYDLSAPLGDVFFYFVPGSAQEYQNEGVIFRRVLKNAGRSRTIETV